MDLRMNVESVLLMVVGIFLLGAATWLVFRKP